MFSHFRIFLSVIIISCFFSANLASAERIPYKKAVFFGLNKITGKVKDFSIPLNETFQFGNMQITPRACYGSASTESSYTDVYVEVNEITFDKDIKNIFAGWMFAESPGLNALEDSVYDIWLKRCVDKNKS